MLLPIGLLVALWLSLRGSLPQYEGGISSTALTQAVTVERDSLGTATIRATNRRDLAWALGYVHAQERYFEMDLLRRRAAGELAELFGAVALPVDRIARAHRMRARMQAAVAALPADQREQIERYADGANAGLAALSVRPFAYLLTRNQPAPWRSEDCLLVVAAMAFTLNDAENKRELAYTKMRATLPETAFRLLTTSGGDWDAPLAGAALAIPDVPGVADLDLRTLDPKLLKPADTAVANLPGSNSFAVGGALAGGAALIANDMHLDLRVPGLWFRARLLYPDPRGGEVDVGGASLPGTPALIAGSNGHVAWGFTNSYVDTADWVRVTRDAQDRTRYRTPDGWTPLSEITETLHVHGAPDETLRIEETRWGPILAEDADGTPLALAWTAQMPGAFNLDLQRLELAHDTGEALAIAQASGLPPQNFLVGDRDGRIGWTLAGRIPRRAGGYDAALPTDWSQAGRGWDGWLPAQDYPRIENPASQRLWTANQRVADAPWLSALGDGGYDLGARAGQIRDDLAARERFAPADLLAIQLDDRALFLERWKDLLQRELERAPKSALNEAMRGALAGWNGHASTDSVAYRLVRAWRNEVVDTVLDGFAAVVRRRFADFALPTLAQGEYTAWKLVDERPAHLLPPGYADWDALLLACAERVGGKLDAQPGRLAARSWGERNTMRIAHPVSRGLPAFLARFLDMPYEALPGDSNMPRVQGPSFGASERFAVAPGDEANGYFMMAGGQSGHPLSPYYGAGHADWAAGRPTPFLPGPAQHVLTMTPATR
ncbi:penicillin acylase family protein [Dokdonella sp.]|uniref:penicillin acylase family protein n=1 Tax=Dokdonella sp. TaxID=2291710 RepID=UPI0025BB0CDD|nr:penicillin acylase family protein [Dokdonella sp.]